MKEEEKLSVQLNLQQRAKSAKNKKPNSAKRKGTANSKSERAKSGKKSNNSKPDSAKSKSTSKKK